jgi:hypothetical protein
MPGSTEGGSESHPQTAFRSGTDRRNAEASARHRAKLRLREADARLADTLSLAELNALAEMTERVAASVAADADLSSGASLLTDEKLPPRSEIEVASYDRLRLAFAERQRLLSGALSVAQVATLLGTGRQTPHDRRKAGTLIAVKDRGEWRFPDWQFDPAGPDGIVEGLAETLRALEGPMSYLATVAWFVTPKSLLGGRTPLQALRERDLAAVLTEAESVRAS